LQVVVVNLKEGEVEELDAKIWPDDREGSYKVSDLPPRSFNRMRGGLSRGLLLEFNLAHGVFEPCFVVKTWSSQLLKF